MHRFFVNRHGEPPQPVSVSRFPCRIGRDSDVEVPLQGWRVARVHAQVERCGASAFRLRDLGSLGGTRLNGIRIQGGVDLQAGDRIEVSGYQLVWQCHSTEALGSDETAGTRERLVPHAPADADSPIESNMYASAEAQSGAFGPQPSMPASTERQRNVATFVQRQRELHGRLIQAMDLRRNDIARLPATDLRVELEAKLHQLIDQDEAAAAAAAANSAADSVGAAASATDRERLIQACIDEAIGFGPLQSLLTDDGVTEIMVNSPQEVFIERAGRLERADAFFTSEQAVRDVIERIVGPLGRRIDEASPMVDARLPDGARVNVVLPPLALKGPAITIRKFSGSPLAASDLLRLGSLDERMLEFLAQCIRARRNIAISGGTGSGKTTLLNILAGLIPAHERIVTIEDAAELRLPHVNLVSLEARPANAEGRGEVVIRDLVRNALRMRPDRIVIGECRGGETLDMLQAMNTGHDGSMTTLHANSARDVASRLETMALMAGFDIPVMALRQQIASAIHIVIQQARLGDGIRRVIDISEVTGIDDGRLLMQCLFRYQSGSAGDAGIQPGGSIASGARHVRSRHDRARQDSARQDSAVHDNAGHDNAHSASPNDGHFVATGVVPNFYDRLSGPHGAPDRSIFNRREPG